MSPHVVAHGDVVVVIRGDRHVPLAEQGVEKAVVVHAVVVVLLDNEPGGVEVVHPVGDLLVVLALTYMDLIKWFTNRSDGLPAYLLIDMVTQNVELVRLEEGIKYTNVTCS